MLTSFVQVFLAKQMICQWKINNLCTNLIVQIHLQ